jgi:allophanate hydrolase
MSVSLSSLRSAYLSGTSSPGREVERFLKVAAEPTWAAAWIHRVDAEALRAQAEALEAAAAADPEFIAAHPLYGVLYAAKDNIDAAGMPTTAACPAFAYTPERSSAAVERLAAAGAILVGKTNMDQFATGLVGTRSPYGVVPNAVDPAFVAGGSSSGSAVAVARGWVGFSLGTDTAGSGRVPAGFNGIVGLKPSRGLVSARGVVPACRSLDCVSVFASSVADAVAVLAVLRGPDIEDPWSRDLPLAPDRAGAAFRFAVPRAPEFFGDAAAQRAFERAVTRLEGLGGRAIEIDFAPFLEAAALLYEGPWVAERLSAIRPFFEAHAADVHEVVRGIVAGAAGYDAARLFDDLTRREALRKRVEPLWSEVEALVVPTAPTHYRIDAVLADPLTLNRRLGYYTNFVNLLDLAALAVPAGARADGLPFGITLIQRAGSDLMLADLGQRFEAGADGTAVAPAPAAWRGDAVDVAVVGAHLSGQPLNAQLTERGGRLLRACRTARHYRLFSLPASAPPKPGLIRDLNGDGHAIEVEVWRLPMAAYGGFVAAIPSPLGVGRLELEDGTWVQGFLCEAWAVESAEEISSFGGWRGWLAARGRPQPSSISSRP